MKHLLASLCILPSFLYAQEAATIGRENTYGEMSNVTIQATEQPGAIAEVVFNNHLNNNDGDISPSLTFDGVEVGITYQFNVNGTADDSISVVVPFGYYTVPETIQVMEYGSGVIYIYPELTS